MLQSGHCLGNQGNQGKVREMERSGNSDSLPNRKVLPT